MAVKSTPFGPVIVTGSDAARLMEHIEMCRLDPDKVARVRARVKELIAKHKVGR